MFVASSIVIVVTVFLYFLYQTRKLNNLARFDYDIDPSVDRASNSYELICPPGYSYDRTEEDDKGNKKDYCKSMSSSDEISFNSLQKNDEFKYPDLDTGKYISSMNDRCEKWSTDNYDWPAVQPYCEYLDVHKS